MALAFRAPSLDRVDNLTDEDRDALALMVLSAVFSGYDGARLERALTQGEQPVADSATATNFGLTSDAIWMRVDLRLAAGAPRDWLLQVAYPPLDSAQLYVPDGQDRKSVV